MKKLVSTAVITGLLFFSCKSTELSPSSLTDVQELPVEISDGNESDSPEELSDESEDTDISETPSDLEITDSADEELITDNDISIFVPEPELIPSEELEADLSSIAEISDSEISDTENNGNEKLVSKPEETKTVVSEINKPTATENKKTDRSEESVKTSDAISETHQADSFDLQKDASEASEIINGREEPEQIIIPSRNIKIDNNQFLDINYPGTGWVYLGEVERENILVFHGRKIDKASNSTTFTLRSRKSGKAVLHFYKNDNLTGKYIDDYIEVVINTESAVDDIHVKSPDYASVVPPKPVKPQPVIEETPQSDAVITESKTAVKSPDRVADVTKPADSDLNIQTIIQNANMTQSQTEVENSVSIAPADSSKLTDGGAKSPVELTGDLLEQAKKAYEAKKYTEALEYIRAFLSDASERIDEGIFTEAQILEANSDVQNIKEAISDYETVIKNWPASRFWKKAKERSIYLQRFYIDIR